jgi:hypothetical protein
VRRLAVALLAVALAACARNDDAFTPPKAKKARALRDVTFERTPERLARGKQLTEGLLQCFVCHSDRDWKSYGAPPVKRILGAGHVFWEETDGTRLVAPNLTPDVETGAGSWTDDMLARAIREGIGHDGRVLHPQMWYASFRNLSDEDLASVVVALRALPPVKRRLPHTRLSPKRYADLEAREEFGPLTKPVPEPDRSDPVAYGKYLVRAADCQGCHTAFEAPLNPGLFGGGNLVSRESGSGLPKLTVISRNITADPSGIPYYDDALFIEAMRTGKVRAREISPIMPFIVFGRLPDAELSAMFAYLKTVPPVAHVVDRAEAEAPCAMCGQTHGGGRYNKPKDAGAIPIDEATARALAGTYRFEDGYVMKVRFENGKLLAGDGKNDGEYFTKDGRLFVAKRDISVLEPVRDASGRVTGLVDRGYLDLKGTRVE